jgi:hypothetical protein
MSRRRPNPRMAKSRYTYDVAEIADLYGCHRNTVRNWFKLGLQTLDETRPALVHGSVLNAFHTSRRAASKRPCGPAEIYCLPCHKPQRPAGDIVDCVPVNPKVWKVSAICPTCGGLMIQRVGSVRLGQFRALLDVTDRKPSARIGETDGPSADCDFDAKGLTR